MIRRAAMLTDVDAGKDVFYFDGVAARPGLRGAGRPGAALLPRSGGPRSMSSRLQDRRVRLLIANRVAEDYKSIVDVTEITDLRVKFSVKSRLQRNQHGRGDDLKSVATASVSFAKQRASSLCSSAATSSGVKQIFQGDVRQVVHRREGADWQTEIKSGDGEQAFQFARASESFGAKSSRGDVLRKLVSAFGLGRGNVSQVASKLIRKFDHGFVAHGPVSRELDKALAGTGYRWSIQDEQVIILKDSEVSGQDVPELTPQSGLIGSPEFGAPAS